MSSNALAHAVPDARTPSNPARSHLADLPHHPAPAPRRAPKLSVIAVADGNASSSLTELATLCQRAGAELIVVRTSATPGDGALAAYGARLIDAPADASLETLRAIGARAASGDLLLVADQGRPPTHLLDLAATDRGQRLAR